MNKKLLKKIFIITSISLFIISLQFNAYCTDAEGSNSSFFALIFGTFGVMSLPSTNSNYAWLANPLLLISWLSFFKENKKLSLWTGILASILSLSFLFCNTISDSHGGGGVVKIISLKAGYWLWMASTLVMAVGNIIIILWYFKRTKRSIPDMYSHND